MKINNLVSIFKFLSLLFLFTKPSQQASNYSTPLPKPRLFNAFLALQAWKHAITDDAKNFTSNWYGPDVCKYNGVFCAPAPDNPHEITVAGIDLNHAGIAGTLPEELGLLTDLALFHLNSNRFKGKIPDSFRNLHLLYELDVSNNLLSGNFPSVVLCLPSLKFLDIRFNKFQGKVPPALFDKKLDALFINNNDFQFTLPKNLGNSTVSVLVLANNNLQGCLPSSIGKMARTLNEIIISNAGLVGCLPDEIGFLTKLTVFDVSSNRLVGSLPESIGNMKSLEQLNVAHNKLSGAIPESVCSLPRLENFTFADNYFCTEPASCRKIKAKDDSMNCIPHNTNQRPDEVCRAFYSHPVDCSAFGCVSRPLPSPSPPPPPPPHHY
ncbi:leucine-rich repeat extensin-like protein 6 [Dorcoceras hygrometricum]|nr:leucine-rich repeat extensin-like protein 6 [Dorcoceras hygrometricum]